mmetsp:Transcript_40043/g.79198  ORF Transcript_40043/g.79198 Transcript_40043/m.79198 type:complete len:83 (+) Transcript_40043:46-294(+)
MSALCAARTRKLQEKTQARATTTTPLIQKELQLTALAVVRPQKAPKNKHHSNIAFACQENLSSLKEISAILSARGSHPQTCA